MKLVKTIVATAVIVFALTTVAMAGVQRLGHEAETATVTAQAQPAAGAAAQHAGAVTLSAGQFAALLGAVTHDGDRDRVENKTHKRSATRARTHAEAHVHAATHAARHAQDGTTSGGGATHHAETPAHTHTAAQAHADAGTHDGGTYHDGGHD